MGSTRNHALKNDAAPAAAKVNSGAAYVVTDGVREIAHGERRSDVMRAAKHLPLGTTCGRAGESPSFVLTERGWLFTG